MGGDTQREASTARIGCATWKSLVAQGDERVDGGRAAGGHVAGSESDEYEQQGDADDRKWIGRANAVQKICEIAREEGQTGETKRNANENHDEALTKDEAKNVEGAAPRAIRMPISWVRCETK